MPSHVSYTYIMTDAIIQVKRCRRTKYVKRPGLENLWKGKIELYIIKFKSLNECRSPLSVKEHIAWSYQPLHNQTSALHDCMRNWPGSVLYSDSLQFDFNEVMGQFPSPQSAAVSTANSTFDF